MTTGSIARYRDLAGRAVFVTGGASVIGADMVRPFHDQDTAVWFVDIDKAAA